MKSLKKRRRPAKRKRPEVKEPRWQFNIFVYARATPHYFKVFVHNNRRALLAWRTPLGESPKCEAFYSAHKWDTVATVSKEGVMEYEMESPCLGTFHFYPGSLSHSVIAHEAFHAVMNWANREGCVPFRGVEGDAEGRYDNEELCAEAIGSLVAQCCLELPKLKGLNWGKAKPHERTYWK